MFHNFCLSFQITAGSFVESFGFILGECLEREQIKWESRKKTFDQPKSISP